MGPGGVVWGKNRVQKSRETVPLRQPSIHELRYKGGPVI